MNWTGGCLHRHTGGPLSKQHAAHFARTRLVRDTDAASAAPSRSQTSGHKSTAVPLSSENKSPRYQYLASGGDGKSRKRRRGPFDDRLAHKLERARTRFLATDDWLGLDSTHHIKPLVVNKASRFDATATKFRDPTKSRITPPYRRYRRPQSRDISYRETLPSDVIDVRIGPAALELSSNVLPPLHGVALTPQWHDWDGDTPQRPESWERRVRAVVHQSLNHTGQLDEKQAECLSEHGHDEDAQFVDDQHYYSLPKSRRPHAEFSGEPNATSQRRRGSHGSSSNLFSEQTNHSSPHFVPESSSAPFELCALTATQQSELKDDIVVATPIASRTYHTIREPVEAPPTPYPQRVTRADESASFDSAKAVRTRSARNTTLEGPDAHLEASWQRYIFGSDGPPVPDVTGWADASALTKLREKQLDDLSVAAFVSSSSGALLWTEDDAADEPREADWRSTAAVAGESRTRTAIIVSSGTASDEEEGEEEEDDEA